MKYGLNLKSSATAIIAVTLFLVCACAKPQKPKTDDGKIKVAASSYVPYALAMEILKDIADLQMVVPAGSEPHSFEPLPQTILEINTAAFFFYISNALEPWALKLSDGKGIALAENLPNATRDPHVWMDFDNTSVMAQNMAMHVARLYPATEPQLLRNTLNFQNEIQMLRRLYGKMLDRCESRDIYHIGHMAFGYIAKNYNLNFKPLIGSAPDQEPSAKDMAMMIKQIKENNIKYIFTEEALNPNLAKVIAEETKAKILYLYTIEHVTKSEFEKKISYRQFMMMNLENISQGLNCAAQG